MAWRAEASRSAWEGVVMGSVLMEKAPGDDTGRMSGQAATVTGFSHSLPAMKASSGVWTM